ncbi:MAG: bestrophin family ion channel [Planctomycetota bacterium]
MLVGKRISPVTVLKIEGPAILFFAAFACLVFFIGGYFKVDLEIPLSIVATLGTAVAILLGFKNNSAYDRWWEARKIWGGVVNQSRYLTVQMLAYTDRSEPADEDSHQALLQEVVFRHLAYINTLRLQLRGLDTEEPRSKWLVETENNELADARNKATQILTCQGKCFRRIHEDKRIEQFRLFELMSTVREFFELQGKAERIKSTPLMRHYSHFTTAFVWIFVLMLPFGFVNQMGWKMIPLVVLVSAIFTILDRAGSLTESPFANDFNDVALDAICTTIEIDMLQQIGITNLPEPVQPTRDGVLM